MTPLAGVEIGNSTKQDLWDAYQDNPPAYIRRRDRLPFPERTTSLGEVEIGIDESAAHALAVESGGRVTIGIGRGDSALAHLGRAPASVAHTERYVRVLRLYLRGEPVSFDDLGFSESTAPDVATLGLADTPSASRLVWRAADDPVVTVEVA